MKRSPLFIRIAMHYWYSPYPWPDDEMHDAHRMVYRELAAAGLI